jgi:predicted metal-dependent peptidase
MNAEFREAFDSAKLQLISMSNHNMRTNPVFYSTLLFGMKHMVVEPSDGIATAAVDGICLYINPDFFVSLTPGQRIFLLVHECLHVAYRHPESFALVNLKEFSIEIEQRLYNEAGDYIINRDAIAAGYEFIPGGLHDRRFNNSSTLQAYKILHDEYKKNPQNFVFKGGSDVIFITDDGSDEARKKRADLSAQITDIVHKAVLTSVAAGESPGNIPAEIAIKLDAAMNPRLPFEIILANYMSAYAQDDYSYRRPNRRYLPDLVLPTLHSPALCNIACAFDLSGSTSQKERNSYAAGVRIIQEMLRPEEITIIEFDTVIHSIQKLTRFTQVTDLEFHGGGGTDVAPVLTWARKNNPEVILIFTDGGFYMPDIPINSDIIWIISDNPKWRTDTGKVIHYKID